MQEKKSDLITSLPKIAFMWYESFFCGGDLNNRLGFSIGYIRKEILK